MYDSYLDVVATLKSNFSPSRMENQTRRPSFFLSSNLARNFSGKQSMPDLSHKDYEDFILLAEFCENQGPVPVFTIPNEICKAIDLNLCVMNILSSDHQTTSNGKFAIVQDIQVLISDDETNINCFVHYFTLYDIGARGYVRRMCMAYVSSDHKKLVDHFSSLKENFTEISRYLKHYNLSLFKDEINNYMLQNIGPEKCHEYKKITKTKVGVRCKLSRPMTEEILRVLEAVKCVDVNGRVDNILSGVKEFALDIATWEGFCKLWPQCKTMNNITICESLSVSNKMKNIFELAMWGAILAVCLLLRIQRIYKKNGALLMIELQDLKLQEPILGTLSINKNVLLNVFSGEKGASQHSNVLCPVLDKKKCIVWFKDFFPKAIYSYELKRLFSPVLNCHPSSDSESQATLDEITTSHLSSSKENNFRLCKSCGKQNYADFCVSNKKCENFLRQSFVNSMQPTITPDRPGYGLTVVFKKYSCFNHLMYSLFMGRLIIVTGCKSAEDEIRNIVQALDLFIPEQTGRDAILPWSRRFLSFHDLLNLKVIGMSYNEFRKLPCGIQNYCSILEVETKLYRGPLYNGNLLSNLAQLSHINLTDELLAAHLFCLLTSITNNVLHFYRNSLDMSIGSNSSFNTTSGVDVEGNSNLAHQDFNIIQNFSDLLKKKQLSLQIEDFTDENESFARFPLIHERVVVLHQKT